MLVPHAEEAVPVVCGAKLQRGVDDAHLRDVPCLPRHSDATTGTQCMAPHVDEGRQMQVGVSGLDIVQELGQGGRRDVDISASGMSSSDTRWAIDTA